VAGRRCLSRSAPGGPLEVAGFRVGLTGRGAGMGAVWVGRAWSPWPFGIRGGRRCVLFSLSYRGQAGTFVGAGGSATEIGGALHVGIRSRGLEPENSSHSQLSVRRSWKGVRVPGRCPAGFTGQVLVFPPAAVPGMPRVVIAGRAGARVWRCALKLPASAASEAGL